MTDNQNAADPKKLLTKAIKLLSYRPRSAGELKRRGLSAVIPRLIQLDLIDDEKFSRWWVDQRCRFRPRGNRALTAELLQKGVDREIIQAVLLTPAREEKLAKKLLAKKRPADKAATQRLLFSRGFSPDLIFRLI